MPLISKKTGNAENREKNAIGINAKKIYCINIRSFNANVVILSVIFTTKMVY